MYVYKPGGKMMMTIINMTMTMTMTMMTIINILICIFIFIKVIRKDYITAIVYILLYINQSMFIITTGKEGSGG